ncbi:MAG: hypothetical protein ACHREM_11440 [Polyangiales bacterium]
MGAAAVAGCGGNKALSTASASDASTADPTNTATASANTTAVAHSSLGWAKHGGSFVGSNAAQRFSTTVDAAGARLAGTISPWNASLHLARIGRDAAMNVVPAVAPTAREARVEFAHDGFVEWYTHDARGLEQGFDVAKRPTGIGDLVIEVTVDGLDPALAADGRSIDLDDARGARERVEPDQHYAERQGRRR